MMGIVIVDDQVFTVVHYRGMVISLPLPTVAFSTPFVVVDIVVDDAAGGLVGE